MPLPSARYLSGQQPSCAKWRSRSATQSENGGHTHCDCGRGHDRRRHPTNQSQSIMDGKFPHDLWIGRHVHHGDHDGHFAPGLCSLIPAFGVKLSAIILAGPTVLSAVGACPPPA
jgi:hypothetical protein